jgi:hypothetical protein
MIPAPSPFVTPVIVPNVAPFLNQAPPPTIGHRMAGFTANLVVKPSIGSSFQLQLMKLFTWESEIHSPVNSESPSSCPACPGFFMLFIFLVPFKYVLITLIEH